MTVGLLDLRDFTVPDCADSPGLFSDVGCDAYVPACSTIFFLLA